MARIDEIGELDVEADTSTLPRPARPAATAAAAPVVVFDHVSFAYRPDQPVLRDVSFSVARAWQTAIVGPSGTGKSTLLALLERFYEPSEGDDRVQRNTAARHPARHPARAHRLRRAGRAGAGRHVAGEPALRAAGVRRRAPRDGDRRG